MINSEMLELNPAEEKLELKLLTFVDTIDEALESFDDIEPLLSEAGLEHAMPFWRTYGAVSKRVKGLVGTGYFNRDQDVVKTLPIFYNQARSPLLAYTWKQPQHMSPDWRRSLYDPAVVNGRAGMQFASFMFTHINSDLAQAAALSNVHKDYKPDFTKGVNGILKEVAEEFAPEFIPLSPGLRKAALNTSLGYIATARELAWRDAMRLQTARSNGNDTRYDVVVNQIERRAVLQGKAIYSAGSYALEKAMQVNRICDRRHTIRVT